jgi:hypothetical protein
MKKAVILFLTLTLILTSIPVFAAETDGFIVIMDIVIARPFGFAALVIGSAFFVVTFPFAAMSKNTSKTADTLVGEPFRFTFVRPPGDFSQSYVVDQNEKIEQGGKDITGDEENNSPNTESSP